MKEKKVLLEVQEEQRLYSDEGVPLVAVGFAPVIFSLEDHGFLRECVVPETHKVEVVISRKPSS